MFGEALLTEQTIVRGWFMKLLGMRDLRSIIDVQRTLLQLNNHLLERLALLKQEGET